MKKQSYTMTAAKLFVVFMIAVPATITAVSSSPQVVAKTTISAGFFDFITEWTSPLINMAKTGLVKYEMSSMARAIVVRSVGKGVSPTPSNFRQYLRDTMQAARDASLDHWDSPYLFERKGRDATIVSIGPDLKRATDDDIRHDFDLP